MSRTVSCGRPGDVGGAGDMRPLLPSRHPQPRAAAIPAAAILVCFSLSNAQLLAGFGGVAILSVSVFALLEAFGFFAEDVADAETLHHRLAETRGELADGDERADRAASDEHLAASIDAADDG